MAVIGHDDVWETDKVEKQITFLEEHPTYNLCFSWADIIDENGQNRNRENKELYQRFCSGNYPTKKWIRKLLESNNFFCAPSVCIRREALQESGGYRYALVQLQDYDLWLRLLKTGEVYIFQEKLTRYRRFFEKGKNISEDNAATRIRDAHERQWIHYNNIKNMSAQEFLEIFSDDLKNPAAIVDANHSNSNKKYKEQLRIVSEVLHTRRYNPDLKNMIKGVMVESYLEEGRQNIGPDMVYGKSITDPCIGWEDTEHLIYKIAEEC